MRHLWLSTVAGVAALTAAVHLPLTQPNDYVAGHKVDLKVNKLWSAKTQLTYDYYSLPGCKPAEIVEESENLGQILLGDRISNSDYELIFGKDTPCQYLCEVTLQDQDVEMLKDRIDNEYTVTWYVDDLPAAVRMMYDDGSGTPVEELTPQELEQAEAEGRSRLERGFPIGFIHAPDGGEGKHYLFNHIRFIISYHQEDATGEAGDDEMVDPSDVAKAGETKYRIVGFEVDPFTVKHVKQDPAKQNFDGNLATCNPTHQVTRDEEPQTVDATGTVVVFTYDVEWRRSPIRWADRWDIYWHVDADNEIHWFSIINSLMIVIFLTGMIAMILLRNLYRDIARYNEAHAAGEDSEETGWKLVHGDVFRPPAGFFGPMFLSVFVGAGAQVASMAVFLLIFAVLGFLSPANQGSLLTAFILLFMFMGSFAGYVSARLYKMFRGKAWKRNTTLTAFAFPGTLYAIAFVLNLFLRYKKSSLAIPLTTMLYLFALWFGIAVPLVCVGSYLGFTKEEVKHPVRVNNIPKQIPEQPWYLNRVLSVLVGGVLPFGAIFIELFFIMSSIWLAQPYYVFGFSFLALLILIVTCAEISIVMCYFQLCAEDYNWWWRSFLTSGSSALYLFLYSIVYFSTKLQITAPVSTMLYFGYMAMISWAFFLFTGSIGFVACLTFVNRIYGAIKVD